MITDILRECASSGTAKKLKKLGFDVAAKTGTFGNENGNSDAYTVSYTTDKTVAAWIGNADGALMDNSVTGGGKAAELSAEILGIVPVCNASALKLRFVSLMPLVTPVVPPENRMTARSDPFLLT